MAAAPPSGTASGHDDKGTYEQLSQSLVGPDPNTVVPTTTATPMMEVVAPANLPENYSFEAQVNGKTFTVQAPPGGVEQGQRFTVPLPSDTSTQGFMLPKARVPVGHWKDSMWNCCAYGCLHAALWNSVFCIPIAAGQVITRLGLTWLGKPANSVAQSSSAYQTIVGIVISWIVVHWGINLCIWFNLIVASEQEDAGIPGIVIFLAIMRDVCFYSYLAFTVYLLRNVRSHLRSKYAIPESESCKTGCEDTCCALVCPCLTAAQMLRHTADYDTYRAVCCSDTGLPSNVPAIV